MLTADLDDYLDKLKIAQQKYAVNAAPCMYLNTESIDIVSDMPQLVSVPEEVLRAYIGVNDEEIEQNIICTLQAGVQVSNADDPKGAAMLSSAGLEAALQSPCNDNGYTCVSSVASNGMAPLWGRPLSIDTDANPYRPA